MKRAIHTALLAVPTTPSTTPLQIILLPVLREQVTYKNTVASSVAEIKQFVAAMVQEFSLDDSLFVVDYSMIEGDDLWYLRQVPNDANQRDKLL